MTKILLIFRFVAAFFQVINAQVSNEKLRDELLKMRLMRITSKLKAVAQMFDTGEENATGLKRNR